MSVSSKRPEPARGGARAFATTHWSVVLAAGHESSPDARAALEKLCRAYWYPLYAFVRSSGRGPDDARDLTQEFFARLLEKKWLAEADPQRGRFRTFLLAALKHFLANEWNRAQRLKRGGNREFLELDALEAEERFALEPADAPSPDALYERRWALTLIARAQDRLRDQMIVAGAGERFTALEPALVGERTDKGYEALAARIGVGIAGVKSMVLRLRRRFRALLRAEIAETLGEGQDVEAELRELFVTLGG